MTHDTQQETDLNSELFRSSNSNLSNLSKKPNDRIAYLDGLRAVAILSVVLFHYYFIFPNKFNISYSKGIGEVWFIKYGSLGVMLFFSISGFVITQTLHTSVSSKHFIAKRFSRLFPAMLVCSLLTYLISFILPTTYTSKAYNFLPSLTFLDPKIYNFIFQSQSFEWMDGAYWSLFTEIRFYTISALIYFANKRNFYRNFLFLAAIVGILFPLSIILQLHSIRSAFNFLLIANQLPWFIFGVGCYRLYKNDNKEFITYSLISFFSMLFYCLAITNYPYMPFDAQATMIGMLAIFVLIYSAIKIKLVSNILSYKPITLIGVASYSFYLLHQEIGQKFIYIIDIAAVKNLELYKFTYLIPLFVLIIGILFSLLMYKYYENPINKRLNRLFKPKNIIIE